MNGSLRLLLLRLLAVVLLTILVLNLAMDYYVPWRGPCALEGEPGGVPAEPGGSQSE